MRRILALVFCLLTTPALADGFAAPPTVLPGYLSGLTLANNGASSIDTGAGYATSDDGTTPIVLSATFNKTIGGTFTAGSGNAGLDTGTAAVSTWYHVFLINNPTTGANDILFSTSVSAPTLPSGFTKKRRIGSVLTTSGTATQFNTFLQVGDNFLWLGTVTNLNAVTPTTTPTNFTVTTPPGLRLLANLRAQYNGSTSVGVRINSPDEPGAAGNVLATNGTNNQAGQLIIQTNLSSQLQYVASAASGGLTVLTVGWTDTRGK